MATNSRQDKYSAIWISYSGINEFLCCPRAYYLQYIYKDPKTRRKLSVITPQLALGQVVHNTLEPLANVPAEKRLQQPIIEYFDSRWQSVAGKRGGFQSEQEEREAKERGRGMIQRVVNNPGVIARKATRIPKHPNGMPPNFYLSEEENIVLCGSIDWLEYLEKTDGIHIVDFKTGKNEEQDGSLQMLIYLLLATNLQSRKVEKASYWYLDRSDDLDEKILPEYNDAHERVLTEALKIKNARQTNSFECPRGGRCFACEPFEIILEGSGEYIGVNDMNKEVYVVST